MILELQLKIGYWFSLLPDLCPWTNPLISLASVFLSLKSK